MKKFLFILLLFPVLSFGIQWYPFGPTGIKTTNINFGIQNVIISDNGFYYPSESGWIHCQRSVKEAIFYKTDTILFVNHCSGTFNDAIFEYSCISQQYHLVEYINCPTFLKQNPANGTFYAGSKNFGLYSSTDGSAWEVIPYFFTKGCNSIDFYGEHIVVTQGKNEFAVFYSDDNGLTWNQSVTTIPINDVCFDMSGKLYGYFGGTSDSSGLYSSNDFGATWQLEFYVGNITAIGTDVFDQVYLGFTNSSMYEGILCYNPADSLFSVCNDGLASLNINKLKFNPYMNSIPMFCCTDSGVYVAQVEPIRIKENGKFDLQIFPNPAHNTIVINNAPKGLQVRIFNISGTEIFQISPLTGNKLDISMLKPGIYFLELNSNQFKMIKKFMKY